VRRALRFNPELENGSPSLTGRAGRAITRKFAAGLPEMRALLVSDVQAALAGDPAASSVAEIMLCYPGTIAVLYHRLAHRLHRLGVPFLARLGADIAHTLTGIDIHPARRSAPASSSTTAPAS
jgi:serine O-acetyltransferase